METLINDYKIAVQAIKRRITQEHPGIVAATLRNIVEEEGPDIYRDIPKLVERLKQRSIRDCAIKQVELVLYGSSLVRYLEKLGNGLSAIDINNIVMTAEQAGLSSKTARKTVSDILYSLSVPQLAQDLSAVAMAEQSAGGAFYIPPSVYSDKLSELRLKVQLGQELSAQDFTELNMFTDAGIPAAYTLLGRVYLEGLGVPKDEQTALDKLKYAASHGDAEAYGLLGDYYYDRDNMKSFEIYSRPGALALSEERWERFRKLHRIKQFHRMQVVLLSVLTLLIELFMILFHTSRITGSHMPAFVVCSVINLIVTTVMWIVHLKNPYQDLRALALPHLIVFFVYAQIII